MKKILFIILITISAVTVNAQEKTLYDFKVKDIDNKDFDLSSLKGKKVLVVNVASLCGLTPQYAELEKLYTTYKDKNFIVIGFPSNDFKGQEPGTNEDIKTFCSSTYGVTFPMMSKTEVVGDSIAPIYKWLTKKSENGKLDADVQWNFQKFMIDEKGHIVDFATPKTNPWDKKIVSWIEN